MAARARFLVLWGTPRDPAAFDRRYRDVHIPLTRKLPGLRRYALSREAAAVRGGEPYHLVAELEFDDMAALRRAFASPEGQATAADAAVLAASAEVRSMVYEVRSMVYEVEDVL